MNFLIADTFTTSLGALTGDEQKLVKQNAFDLQINPASPGFKFHKLDRAKDKNFCSIRVGADLRVIVHKTSDSLLLCYVDHHDPAYAWAERRRLETHPKTGAAQLVELPEIINEYGSRIASEPTHRPILHKYSADDLLEYGVPAQWVEPLLNVVDQDELLDLAGHLPAEAAEAVLELATGGRPEKTPKQPSVEADHFNHPDAQRRFRLMGSVEELQKALEFPWEKWIVFLHPDQRQLVEKKVTGPTRVSGTAGTGKTIVALHRAAHLARTNRRSRILLATFSKALANSLEAKLRILLHSEPDLIEQVDVYSLDEVAKRLYKAQLGRAELASDDDLNKFINQASHKFKNDFTQHFLNAEWTEVVDAWQLRTLEDYRAVPRLGRKTRFSPAKRELLWSLFSEVFSQIQVSKLTTIATIYTDLSKRLAETKTPPFDFLIVDEAQDISVAQIRFVAALGAHRPDALFFTGDLGQRIFQQPFSWKALGVDIRGRSHTLKVNYRTSHQIRRRADMLLNADISDVDGNAEKRNDALSTFSGPEPAIRMFGTDKEEIAAVAKWLADIIQNGTKPNEMALFVRSLPELPRAKAAATAAGLPVTILDENIIVQDGHASIATMHIAKGLEFKAVAVMACDSEVIPSQARIETIADEADLMDVLETERHLLYVACTRARDYLLVSGVKPGSEFLDDMMG
jgi:hypothetical protein